MTFGPAAAGVHPPSVGPMRTPVPKCPIRLGEPCSLCEPGASGPEDCALVWLVMTDPELRARLDEMRRAGRR
ncbi:uncharacterized protein PD653_3585 [Nocardioides sp. PD653]|nr:uncharacterized protein PD653B2_4765 [Nocardioides sp. PD653-B2]GAW56152.1 uncharacterized protein PD653_3585 [Nocardioides sp. PD653]